eukprot:3543634-Rhodomonas_salina.1
MTSPSSAMRHASSKLAISWSSIPAALPRALRSRCWGTHTMSSFPSKVTGTSPLSDGGPCLDTPFHSLLLSSHFACHLLVVSTHPMAVLLFGGVALRLILTTDGAAAETAGYSGNCDPSSVFLDSRVLPITRPLCVK